MSRMMPMQIYVSKDFVEATEKAFGERKRSAGIERIVMAFLIDDTNERRRRLAEIQGLVREFNAHFPEFEADLCITKKEVPPKPPEEK